MDLFNFQNEGHLSYFLLHHVKCRLDHRNIVRVTFKFHLYIDSDKVVFLPSSAAAGYTYGFKGSWRLQFPGINSKITFKSGKVVVGRGRPIITRGSRNRKYPFSQGWITFEHKGWTYYLKSTPKGKISFYREVINGWI